MRDSRSNGPILVEDLEEELPIEEALEEEVEVDLTLSATIVETTVTFREIVLLREEIETLGIETEEIEIGISDIETEETGIETLGTETEEIEIEIETMTEEGEIEIMKGIVLIEEIREIETTEIEKKEITGKKIMEEEIEIEITKERKTMEEGEKKEKTEEETTDKQTGKETIDTNPKTEQEMKNQLRERRASKKKRRAIIPKRSIKLTKKKKTGIQVRIIKKNNTLPKGRKRMKERKRIKLTVYNDYRFKYRRKEVIFFEVCIFFERN